MKRIASELLVIEIREGFDMFLKSRVIEENEEVEYNDQG